MENSSKKQITEEDVMFYDIDTVLYGDAFRVKATPSAAWQSYSVSAFYAWLQDIGHIEWADNDDSKISTHGCVYSFQAFWRDLAISKEADGLISHFAQYATPASPHAWLLDIREPDTSAGEPLSPDGLTKDQEESAWAEFYGLYDETFTHPNQTPRL